MIKILKIALGSAVSIFLANYIGLTYSTAAGIITLLSIQDTRKETIKLSIQRLLSFFVATGIALFCFEIIGYHPISFGIFLFLFAMFGYYFHMNESIPINAVLMTHYLVSEHITLPLMLNELLLLIIGTAVGTLVNLYMPNDVTKIRNVQNEVEQDMKELLKTMSLLLRKPAEKLPVLPLLKQLDTHIETGIHSAYSHMNNRFLQDTRYFISYMEMRKQQAQILQSIYEKIEDIPASTTQSEIISDFLLHIADALKETNKGQTLLDRSSQLFETFRQSPLPVTREEFETRAILYLLLKDIEYFLKLKIRFASSLSEKQIALYWN